MFFLKQKVFFMQKEINPYQIPPPQPYPFPNLKENEFNIPDWQKLIITTLPNFGPISIGVVALPILVYGIKLGLSRGPNSVRMPKIDGHVFCLQKHPNSTHKHTITAEDFPYERKLAVADGFNRIVNKLGGFKTYIQAREYFYETINKEAFACEKDYYSLINEDGIRNGWIFMRHHKDFAKALYEVEKAINILKSARKDLKIAPSNELIGLKVLLLKKLGQMDEYKLEKETLSKQKKEVFSKDEEEFALEILSLLALDENIDVFKPGGIDGLDLLQLWSKELLKNQDQDPLPDEGYPKFFLNQKQGKELLVHFFKAMRDNYAFLVEKKFFHHFPSASLNSSLERGGMPFLKTFFLDLTSFLPPFEEIKDTLKYLSICAKADINLNLLLDVQENNHREDMVNRLLVEPSFKEVIIEEKGTVPLPDTKIIVLDTDSQNRREASHFHEELVHGIKNHQVTFITVPSKKVYQLLPDKHPLPFLFIQAAEALKKQIFKAFEQEKKQKLLLISHHKGIEIIQRASKLIPTNQLEKIVSLIFSPSALVPKIIPKEIYFYSPKDKVTAKVVLYYENFKFSNALVQILIDSQRNGSKSKIAPSRLCHPIYKNKVIELINRFM